MDAPEGIEPVATFCGNCNCGCPELFLDPGAPEDRRVRITDDFGQEIRMSVDQFGDLVRQAKAGLLDLAAVAAPVD